MDRALGLVGSVAVVSFAIGALLWALGREAPGKRAMVFGIVLMIVGEALARQGAALVSWLQAHADLVGLAFAGAVLLAALLRFAAGPRRSEPKFSKKRRVESGP